MTFLKALLACHFSFLADTLNYFVTDFLFQAMDQNSFLLKTALGSLLQINSW